MFLAFLREQEEKVRETRKNKNMKKRASRTWIKKTMRNCSFLNWMEYCSKKLDTMEMYVLSCFNTQEYENL
jgi:hypothetical protein